MSKLIYVLGCPGSGTTLLQNLFRCTKNTMVVDGEYPPSVLSFLKNQIKNKNIVLKRCSTQQEWGASFAGQDPWKVLKRLAVTLMGESASVNFTEEKIATAWIDWLSEWQDYWYIHIRRDPRDALLTKHGLRKSLYENWKASEVVFNKLSAISDKIILVNFEELVSKTNIIMGEICSTIGLEANDEFTNWMNYVDGKHPSLQGSNKPRPVDIKSIGRWKENEKNINQVKEMIKKYPEFTQLIVDFGYDQLGWQDKI